MYVCVYVCMCVCMYVYTVKEWANLVGQESLIELAADMSTGMSTTPKT